MSKTATNLLPLNHEEAMDFFMKSKQYPFLEKVLSVQCLPFAPRLSKTLQFVPSMPFLMLDIKYDMTLLMLLKRNGIVLFSGLYSENDNIVKVTNYG